MAEAIGSIQFNYHSKYEVEVSDTTPDPGTDPLKNHAFHCPFVHAVKLLSNYPPPTGKVVVKDALAVLRQRIDNKQIEAMDTSLLGISCKQTLKLTETSAKAKWKYAAQFYLTKLGVDCITNIAKGDEDYFHRASIDVGFEWFKRRWQKLYETDIGKTSLVGVSMLLYYRTLFERLNEPGIGVENVLLTYRIANMCTNEWLSWLAERSK
jgi:hypothetical protein